VQAVKIDAGHNRPDAHELATSAGEGSIGDEGGRVCFDDGYLQKSHNVRPSDQLLLQWGAWKSGVFCLSMIFFGLVRFVKFVVN
jgi:hypothetical protein